MSAKEYLQNRLYTYKMVFKFTFSFHTDQIILKILKVILTAIVIAPAAMYAAMVLGYSTFLLPFEKKPSTIIIVTLILYLLIKLVYFVLRFFVFLANALANLGFIIANLPECKQYYAFRKSL